MLFILKKHFIKLFYNYTCMIYEENGKKLSQRQKMILKARIIKIAKDYTLKEKIKRFFKKLFTKKK